MHFRLFYFHVTKYAKVSPQISLLVLSNFKQINYLLFSPRNRQKTISQIHYSLNIGSKIWRRSTRLIKPENVNFLFKFTLHSILKGNKLDFHLSMAPDQSKEFYGKFLDQLKSLYVPELIKGIQVK